MDVTTFTTILKDYSSLLKGITKLAITQPTDLQQQLLSADPQLESFVLTAPPDSGKSLALLLYSLRRFINDEEGILLILAHSKDFSQSITHHTSILTRLPLTNLFMQQFSSVEPKQIIVGSPLQAYSLSKSQKERVTQVLVLESDLLFGFGFGDSLHNLASSLPKAAYKLSCVERTPQIDAFKSAFMKDVLKIDYKPPTVSKQPKKEEGAVTHFYAVGDKVLLPISLYVTLKFNLINPKILILCESLKEVYRYQLFLERCHISSSSVYNFQNPIDLKFYTLSLWMNGATQILIATKELLADLSGTVFKQNCLSAYKHKRFELINMTTVITLNLSFLPKPAQLFALFVSKPFLITFIEHKEEEISALQKLMKVTAATFEVVNSKELPVTRKELEGFRYRINDLFMTIGTKKVEYAIELDFKKKLLKSPDMKEHFSQNQQERALLIRGINDLRKKIQANKVTISQIVPEYLVPECLKTAYAERVVLVRKAQETHVPEHHAKVRRVLKYVNLEEENPEQTEASRLKLISARKRWKLQHGFKLKKRNLRNEKKGIFDTQ